MNNILAFLRSPYPAVSSVRAMLIRSILFGLFVFLFLLLFQPFGLSQVKQDFISVIAGYGLICTLTMIILNIAVPRSFPGYFNERSWTSGREIFWTLINIGLIGLANALYSSYLGMFALGLKGIIMFEVYTFLIGVIPVSMGVLLKKEKLEKEFRSASETINSVMPHDNPGQPSALSKGIELRSDYSGHLTLNSNDLLFVRAADNYAEVFFIENGLVKQKMLRTSLRDMESALAGFPCFFRCHKSYLVNLDHVQRVSGNAQGLKLHLNYTNEEVPVSRNHTRTIRERLTVHP